MGFFKDFKDEVSGAVNEIVTEDNSKKEEVIEEVNDIVEKPEPKKPLISDTTKFSEDTEVAVITKGLKIKGDIECDGAIEIYGTVEGNIDCNGKLVVCGTMTGNAVTNEFFANKAHIKGDVSSTGNAKIGLGTKLIGNVSATGAVVAGAIKGNIDVKGPVILDSTAVVMGDIKSKTIQINNGAIIDGRFSQCYSEVSAASYFEESEA